MIRTGRKILLAALAAFFFAASFSSTASSQKGLDTFLHSTKSHKKIECSSCHKNPTSNWTSARGYPDIADYPDHASCVQCHRNDFFRGNRPTICAVCHTSVSPRSKERFEFPVRERSQEFETIFPHDVHQNIIAKNERRTDVAVAHFINVSFRNFDDDDKESKFNNCAICHPTATNIPKFASIRPLELESLANPSSETIALEAERFKDSPDNHASCFNCHYQNLKPIRTDCASCHRITTPYFESNVVLRYSVKFNHDHKNHVRYDCTSCHVRITQVSDLGQLKNADVPLMTCSSSSCHGGDGDDKWRVKFEIAKRKKSIDENLPIFKCTYCHSSDIGSYAIPQSHLE